MRRLSLALLARRVRWSQPLPLAPAIAAYVAAAARLRRLLRTLCLPG